MSTTCPLCEFDDQKTLLISAPSNAEEVIIPHSVKTIYGADETHNAFFVARDSLKSFSFEANSQIQTIQRYAFSQCSVLQSIDLSSCTNLQSIADFAFYHCNSVKSIDLLFFILSL